MRGVTLSLLLLLEAVIQPYRTHQQICRTREVFPEPPPGANAIPIRRCGV
jgi:hypothetical protein